MKYNEEEIADLREKARQFEEQAQTRFQETLDATDDPLADFVCDVLNETQKSELYHGVRADILSGKRPSAVVEERLSWLFDDFIFPRRRACVLYAVDHCSLWNYAPEHAGRRSFRTRDPQVLFASIIRLLAWFIRQDCVDADSLALLRAEVGESEKAFIIRRRCVLPPCQIAWEIDAGNAAFIAELRSVILGESEADIDPCLIRGILQSRHAELHELLGKLLLAARLQEGLRQAICENADMGTVEGFRAIMRVIHENGLIRYSSVKRAFGVWTGLIANLYDARAADLERISGKTETLAWTLLNDAAARSAALETEDSMQIYLALWAAGVEEAQDATAQIHRLAEQGSHHQLLTACYALRQFCEPQLSHPVAAALVARQPGQEVLATCLPAFMPRVWSEIYAVDRRGKKKAPKRRPVCSLGHYFANRAEAESYFELLLAMHAGISGKVAEFSPCIFPWNRERLEKEEIVVRLAWIASALQDDALIDRVLDFLGDVGYGRAYLIALLLPYPQTEKQKRLLVELVCDKQEDARKQAAALLPTMELSAAHYKQAESMLRYRNADMRETLISLLLEQEDAALLPAVARLLADKKEEKRTAGLDIVLRLNLDEARPSLAESCRRLVAAGSFPASREQLLAAQILPAAAEASPAALYDGSERYEPALPMDYIAQGEEVFNRYFCKRGLLASLRGKPADFEPVLDKLSALMKAHEADEFTTSLGDTETLGNGSVYMRRQEDGSISMPLAELWDAFYAAEIRTPVLAMRALMALLSEGDYDECAQRYAEYVKRYVGAEFTRRRKYAAFENMVAVCKYYMEKYVPREELTRLSAYVAWRLSQEETLCIRADAFGKMCHNKMI